MNQQNNISIPKGRRVFLRRILFFLFFDFSSHCFGSRFEPEKIHGPGEKAGQYRKRDYHGERKDGCTETPQKVQRYDRVARDQRHRLFLSGYADRHERSSSG